MDDFSGHINGFQYYENADTGLRTFCAGLPTTFVYWQSIHRHATA